VRTDLSSPGAISETLIASGLMAALARVGALPEDDRGLALDGWQSAYTGASGDARWVVVVGGRGRTRAAMLVLEVPVDQTQDHARAWSPRRLRRLKEALARLRAQHPLRRLCQQRRLVSLCKGPPHLLRQRAQCRS
jgi:hypothetical protein